MTKRTIIQTLEIVIKNNKKNLSSNFICSVIVGSPDLLALKVDQENLEKLESSS